MRLTQKQQQLIITTLRRYFGEATEVLLFSSRVDDTAKGGILTFTSSRK